MFNFEWLGRLTKAQRTTSRIPRERVRRFMPKTKKEKPLPEIKRKKKMKQRKTIKKKDNKRWEDVNQQYAVFWKSYQKTT